MAFVGLLDGQPYEIFTGRAEDIFMLPPWVTKGWVIKEKDEEGNNRYDFQFADKYGYKVTMEGLSRSFDKEYWNYAKLISGALRHGMPLPYVINMVDGLNVNVKGKQKVALEGTVEASLKGAQTKIEGTGTLDLSSKGQAKLGGLQVSVEGQVMAEVKGAMVMIN